MNGSGYYDTFPPRPYLISNGAPDQPQLIHQNGSSLVWIRNPQRHPHQHNNIFQTIQPEASSFQGNRHAYYFGPGEGGQITYTPNTYPFHLSRAKILEVSGASSYSGSALPRIAISHQHEAPSFPGVNENRRFIFPEINFENGEGSKNLVICGHPNLKTGHNDTRSGNHSRQQTTEEPVCSGNTLPKYGKQNKKVPIAPGCTGLINLGNTCYMNSVLQCLSHTKVLQDYCHKDYKKDIKSKKGSKGVLAEALADMFRQLWSGRGSLDPSEFRKKMLTSIKYFQTTEQEDAQEFLIFLLQGLSEDLCKNKLKKKYQSIRLFTHKDKFADNAWKEFLEFENSAIIDIFMGQLRSSLTCCACNYDSNTFDPILGLSLPIPERENGTPVTLLSCLEHYFQRETLFGRDKPECSNCNKKSDANKLLSIQKFPKIFVIHLKRFGSHHSDAKKISTSVVYPVGNLNFRDFAHVDANVVYDLYAVVQHYGNLANGHYTASIRNVRNGVWYHYDDDLVSTLSQQSIVNQHAYILFYQLHSAQIG